MSTANDDFCRLSPDDNGPTGPQRRISNAVFRDRDLDSAILTALFPDLERVEDWETYESTLNK